MYKLVNRVLNTFGSSYFLMPARIEKELICAWCAESYVWSGSPLDNRPLFCCKGHKQKSQVARKKRQTDAEKLEPAKPANPTLRYSTGTAKACPRPEKERHGSFFEAWEVINRVDKTMHPYTCRCGYIHIGH